MLEKITELSNRYGADPAFTLAGGGNTSCKDEKYLYVKPSGVSLAAIRPADFVKMDRAILRECFAWDEFADKQEREERAKKLMAYAVVSGDGRPSVEAPLHEAMPFTYVVHLHPALVNGMTCGRNGRAVCAQLFSDALWVDYCDPGYTLAKTVFEASRKHEAAQGKPPAVIFLQNHGVFVGGDTPAAIAELYAGMMARLAAFCREQKVPTELRKQPEPDPAAVSELAPELRGCLGEGDEIAVVSSTGAFALPTGPLTPDHLVYAKAFGLTDSAPTRREIAVFKEKYGYLPRMVAVPEKAVFCAGKNRAAAETVRLLAENGALVEQLAAAFGGVRFLSDQERGFIENWEVESYRAKVAAGTSRPLTGLVAVVTGGAQGFGFGIAQYLAAQGADIVIADLNAAGAAEAAAAIGPAAAGLEVNIADEAAVEKLFAEVVKLYGGFDLLVANAGVLKAGSVKDFAYSDWEKVTDINYNGYFLCVKHAARLMARQNRATGRWSDIVQVNSKSGLVGSKNNGAYAGSKFGAIGLTQSFALELVADRIKVNSVCPGNFYEGPLWSDPERGLFVQYLNTGKVPGAKTVADVKAYYESLAPMRRGCTPEDVGRAIVYAVIQQYETGQAIPVTGGQVMLS